MITRQCKLCGKQHEIFYVQHSNLTNHLLMVCSIRGDTPKKLQYLYIPFEDNLNIETHLTKHQTRLRSKKEPETLSLFT